MMDIDRLVRIRVVIMINTPSFSSIFNYFPSMFLFKYAQTVAFNVGKCKRMLTTPDPSIKSSTDENIMVIFVVYFS